MRAKGWKKVLKFTFMQNLKAKSFKVSTIVSLVIFALIVLGVNFIPLVASSDSGLFDGIFGGKEITLDKVYVSNQTELAVDYKAVYGDAQIEMIDTAGVEAVREKVKTSEKAELLVLITGTDGAYSIVTEKPESTDALSNSDCRSLNSLLSDSLHGANLSALGISKEQFERADTHINTSVVVAGETESGALTQMVQIMLPLILSLVLFMLIFSYGMLIAQSIAQEKTSKIMELLLTSVEPLAIVIGKVFATLLIALIQLMIVSIGTGIVFLVSAPFGILGQLLDVMRNQVGELGAAAAVSASTDLQMMANELSGIMATFTPVNIVLILLTFLLGFVMFSLIAALFGASVSRIEDLQMSMQPYSFIGVLGFYLAYFPSIFNFETGDSNIFMHISYYVPISSPFALPAAIATGTISTAHAAIAVLVLAVFNVLVAMLVARMYEGIILYSGERLTVAKMFKLSKTVNS